MYKRKTKDVWFLKSNYGYGWESEGVYEDLADAKADLQAYRENVPEYGGIRCYYRLEKKRVRIKEAAI